MKNINNKLWPLLLMAIVLSACSKTTTIRHHKNFQNHLSKSKTLTILPATVEVVSVDASGKTTRNYNYEALVEDVIIDVLRPKLGQLGYKTKFLSRRKIHNNKLSRNVLSFREDYNKKIAELYNAIEWQEEKAKNVDLFLAKPAKEVAKLAESDLIIFVEYHLRAKTSGACTKDLAIAVLSAALAGASSSQQDPAELLSLRIAIINPHNGQFVWSNFARTGFGTFSGAFSKNAHDIETKRLKEIFDTTLKALPSRDKLGN